MKLKELLLQIECIPDPSETLMNMDVTLRVPDGSGTFSVDVSPAGVSREEQSIIISTRPVHSIHFREALLKH